MKKALSIILAAAMLIGALVAVGCLPNPEGSGRETGNVDVDYGKLVEDGGTIQNVLYADDTPITFMYPNYFTRSSDEGEAFVAKGPDDYSVLMYQAGELSESRTYEDIAAYTDDEAKDWMTVIQLGLVSSQRIDKLETRDYRFVKLEDHLYMLIDAEVTYSTGLVQRNTLVNYILPEGKIYTIQAYAPLSAVEKYGPLFSDVKYGGYAGEEPLPEDFGADTYAKFDNGTISFEYRSVFTADETNGVILSMVPDYYAMLAGGEGSLEEGRTYEQLKAMTNEEILDYLSSVTAVPVTEAEYVNAAEENGVLRIEARYCNEGAVAQKLYCVVTRFIKEDGSLYTLFAYMSEPEPIKNISYNA